MVTATMNVYFGRVGIFLVIVNSFCVQCLVDPSGSFNGRGDNGDGANTDGGTITTTETDENTMETTGRYSQTVQIETVSTTEMTTTTQIQSVAPHISEQNTSMSNTNPTNEMITPIDGSGEVYTSDNTMGVLTSQKTPTTKSTDEPTTPTDTLTTPTDDPTTPADDLATPTDTLTTPTDDLTTPNDDLTTPIDVLTKVTDTPTSHVTQCDDVALNLKNTTFCHLVCNKAYIGLDHVVFKAERIDPKATSKYRRSLTSAKDDRLSVVITGSVGVAIMTCLFVGVVVLDAGNLVKMFKCAIWVIRRRPRSRDLFKRSRKVSDRCV